MLRAKLAGTAHELVTDPASADLILLLGSFAREPALVLEHPLYNAWPERCAVYTEDDGYLPLLPGLYTSARQDSSTRCGRVRSYSYMGAGGKYTNAFVGSTLR